MAGLNLKAAQWEQQHKEHVEEYLTAIDVLYDDAVDELVKLGMKYAYDPTSGKTFAFSQNKARQKQVDKTIRSFSEKLQTIVAAGIAAEWAFANDKVDSWVRQLFDNPQKGWMLRNLEALDAFQNRRILGHTLSERVWDYSKQLQKQIELSLSVGISEGRSAANISRDVRIYLNEPDKLFRRVRDAFGNLTLSKAAQAYHPGQGVYRSSYQNAMRMARTEINGAYREADHIRWQQLDFIVGYEVKTSKSHAAWLAKFWYPRFKKGRAPLEICDAMEGKYPKSFKFIGWHPNCRCYAVPIIANEGTDKDWWEEAENEVTEVPPRFKEWLIQNADRIEKANNRGTLPYWITENKQYTDVFPTALNSNKRAEIIASARKTFDKYGTAWTKAYFDERSGGYYVIHRAHQFAKKGGGGDAELVVSRMLAKYNGKRVEMLAENQGVPSPDIRFDGKTWDIKAINTANIETIRKYIKNARKADNVIFYADSDRYADVLDAAMRELGKLRKENKEHLMPDVYYIGQNGLLRLLKEIKG